MGQDKKWYAVMGILLVMQLAVAWYFGTQKAGFHYDEYYSYYSSNVTYGLVPTDRAWKDTAEIRSEFMVLPGEGFRFGDVVRMQTYDVHPPLYYLLLHAVCSLTPGVFSKWSAIALNLILFAACWCVLAALATKTVGALRGRRAGQGAAVLACLLYGFNPAVLGGVMMARMYVLLGFWVTLVTWLHVRALGQNRRGWRFYLPVMAAVYAGFLTHYYFAVYMFFLAAAMEGYLLFETVEAKTWKQKWKDCFAYGFAIVGAMAVAVASYPACLGHIFRGYRGTEAMGAFFDVANTAGRFRFFAGLLNEYVFGSMLPVVLLVLLLAALTVWTVSKRRPKGKGNGQPVMQYRVLWVPMAAAAGYFIVVAKTALLTAEEAIRYQLPVYGLLLLFVVEGVFLLASRIQELLGSVKEGGKVSWGMTAVLASLLLAGELGGLWQGRVLFLYEEDVASVAFAKQNHDVPVIYFYNGNLTWMVWDDSLELMQYDRIYFVNMQDVSPIEDRVLQNADRVLVYAARGKHSAQALACAQEAVGEGAALKPVRELLYCDLYEVLGSCNYLQKRLE